jgi:hypothetical protein
MHLLFSFFFSYCLHVCKCLCVRLCVVNIGTLGEIDC